MPQNLCISPISAKKPILKWIFKINGNLENFTRKQLWSHVFSPRDLERVFNWFFACNRKKNYFNPKRKIFEIFLPIKKISNFTPCILFYFTHYRKIPSLTSCSRKFYIFFLQHEIFKFHTLQQKILKFFPT